MLMLLCFSVFGQPFADDVDFRACGWLPCSSQDDGYSGVRRQHSFDVAIHKSRVNCIFHQVSS